jgi:hypothetical protein
MGRGTTLLEAALLARIPIGCDINPLSRILVEPRLQPPQIDAVQQRLATIDWAAAGEFLKTCSPSTIQTRWARYAH